MRSGQDQSPLAAPGPSRPPPPPYSETDIYSDSTNRQPVFTPPETPPASLGPEPAPSDDPESPLERPSRPRRQDNPQQAPRDAAPRGWLGLRFGDAFAADRSGLTIGGLVLGCRGLRLARRAGGGYAAGSWAPVSDTMPGPDLREDAEEEKWQPYQRPRGRGRSASTSSASSASSASSSSASSSVGSMPDSGRMCVPQLSLYAARLRAWLATPDQVRTRAELDELRADLGRARDPAPDARPDPQAELLAAEIRALGQQWKRLKRRQRKMRRLERRQRRSRRRAERRERRETRRAALRARRTEATGTHAGIFPGLVLPPPPPFPLPCPLPCRRQRPLILAPGIPWSPLAGGRRWAPPPAGSRALSLASNDGVRLAAGRERTSSRRHRPATEEQLWQLGEKLRQTQIEVDELYARHLAMSSP